MQLLQATLILIVWSALVHFDPVMKKAFGDIPKIRGKILLNEEMAKHTSLKVGGPADVFAVAEDPRDVCTLVRWATTQSLPLLVIGAGTNLLVSEKGIRGLVIKLGSGFRNIHILSPAKSDGAPGQTVTRHHQVIAGAAVQMPELVKAATDAGLSGLEGLAGIPGSVGGAVCMNAGTQFGEIKDILVSVRAVGPEGELIELPAEELGLGYRSSEVSKKGLTILEATLALRLGDPDQVAQKVRGVLARRRRNQPSGVHTCGSVFKNPEGDYAGRLLEAAGAKGMSVGDAYVSTSHANWIENRGKASASDIRELMNMLQKLVQEKFDIRLEPEVQIVGEW